MTAPGLWRARAAALREKKSFTGGNSKDKGPRRTCQSPQQRSALAVLAVDRVRLYVSPLPLTSSIRKAARPTASCACDNVPYAVCRTTADVCVRKFRRRSLWKRLQGLLAGTFWGTWGVWMGQSPRQTIQAGFGQAALVRSLDQTLRGSTPR